MGLLEVSILIDGLVAMVAVGALAWSIIEGRKQDKAERRDLLNRIMSRDYTDYANHEVQVNAPPVKVVGIDDLRRELEDRAEADGLPV